MNMYYVLGTDRRFDFLAALLSEKGEVRRCAEPAPDKNAVFLFPFGEEEEVILKTLAAAEQESCAVVWAAGESLRCFCAEKGIRLMELCRDSVYLLQNSLSTAEGVVAEAILNTAQNLAGQTVLVCGYGNCGSQIAHLLWLMGCEIYVFSRASGQARAEKDGFNTFDLDSPRCAMFDLIVNTVPAEIFPKSVLKKFHPGACFLQIATGLSGIDAPFLDEIGVRFCSLRALPAKYAPESEANAISDALFNFLKESE